MRDFENFLEEQELNTRNKDIKYLIKKSQRCEKNQRLEKNKGVRAFSIATLSFVAVSSLIVFVYAKNNVDIPIEQEPVYEEEITIIEEPIIKTEYKLIENEAPEAPEVEVEEVEAVEQEPYYLQYDIPLDEETLRLLNEACETTGIRFELALAVIWKETRFQNKMGDSGASYGYMQVQPRWHWDRMERLGVTDLNDPYSNFLVGCDFLAELLEKYDLPNALTYYNTGHAGYNQYAKDVINYMENLLTEQN